MDSQQPGAKPETSGARMGVPQARGVVRAYPKPPALLPRFVLLVIKPESWPAAAQYPFWVTLLPLILAVVISSVAVAISSNSRFFAAAESFADSYDKQYPALQMNSDGALSAVNGTKEPCDFHFNGNPFVVDPTGKTAFDSVKGDFATLISGDKVYQRAMGVDVTPQPLAEAFPYNLLVPEKGQPPTRIDGAYLREVFKTHRVGFSLAVMTLLFTLKFISEAVWIAVMLFLLRPAVMIGAMMGERRLVMPRRALYRISAALLVPVVLFAGIMQAAGYSAAAMVGGENALILWYFGCAAMAVWAGHMAQQMYAPKAQRPRQS